MTPDQKERFIELWNNTAAEHNEASDRVAKYEAALAESDRDSRRYKRNKAKLERAENDMFAAIAKLGAFDQIAVCVFGLTVEKDDEEHCIGLTETDLPYDRFSPEERAEKEKELYALQKQIAQIEEEHRNKVSGIAWAVAKDPTLKEVAEVWRKTENERYNAELSPLSEKWNGLYFELYPLS